MYKKIFLFSISILISSVVAYAGHYEFAGDGARSKAMGGAFVAIADDATAYSWNPAGMVLLKRPEMSYLARMKGEQRYRQIYPCDPNQWETGKPTYVYTDWHDAIKFQESKEGSGGPQGDVRTINYVYPWKNMAIGFGTTGYEDYIEFRNSNQGGKGPVYLKNVGGKDIGLSWEDKREQEHYYSQPEFGAAFAFNLIRSLSFGFKVGMIPSIEQIETNKSREEYFPKLAQDGNTITSPFYNKTWFEKKPSLLSYSIGVLYRPVSGLSFGLVYKDFSSARMEFDSWTKIDQNYYYPFHNDFDFKYPRFIGAGFAMRIRDVFTISMQVNHIAYTQMDPDRTDNWVFEDAIEYHAGVEYLFFLGKKGEELILPLRFGYYLEPSAQDFYKFQRDQNITGETAQDRTILGQKYGKDADLHHITIGMGFSREQWSFDFALDICQRRFDVMFTPVLYF